ncbi:hypothetical protein ACWPKO_21550 (plasmid) [Coraliomargarita sp. W4R53]
MSRVRFAAVSFLALASIAILPGCTAQGTAFADLQGDKESGDELPALKDYAYDDVDESTSRFVADHEGTSVWLAQGLEDGTVCLIADAGPDAWVVSCGGAPSRIGGVAGTFEVVSDGAPAPSGATQLSDNVYTW